MMQPDLSPAASEAFVDAVLLAVEAASRPSEDSATVAGYAFARFHDLADGRDPATHDWWRRAVFAAAARSVQRAALRAADLPADS